MAGPGRHRGAGPRSDPASTPGATSSVPTTSTASSPASGPRSRRRPRPDGRHSTPLRRPGAPSPRSRSTSGRALATGRGPGDPPGTGADEAGGCTACDARRLVLVPGPGRVGPHGDPGVARRRRSRGPSSVTDPTPSSLEVGRARRAGAGADRVGGRGPGPRSAWWPSPRGSVPRWRGPRSRPASTTWARTTPRSWSPRSPTWALTPRRSRCAGTSSVGSRRNKVRHLAPVGGPVAVRRPARAGARDRQAGRRAPRSWCRSTSPASRRRAGASRTEVPALVGAGPRLGPRRAGLHGRRPRPGRPRRPVRGSRQLVALADAFELPERSIGMSADLEVAVRCGATMVRVGRDLFGARPPRSG